MHYIVSIFFVGWVFEISELLKKVLMLMIYIHVWTILNEKITTDTLTIVSMQNSLIRKIFTKDDASPINSSKVDACNCTVVSHFISKYFLLSQ